MKIRYLLLLIVLFNYSSLVIADHVPVQKAKQAAKNFFHERVNQVRIMEYKSIDLFTVHSEFRNNTPLYYVFNINKDDGFIIISADDDAAPVLGYSFTGSYGETSMPPALLNYMDHFADQIEYIIQNNIKGSSDVKDQWQELEYYSPDGPVKIIRTVEPMILTHWSQSNPYNKYCPEDSEGSGGHAVVGCTALSMAQVIKYHNHPPQGTGSHSYYHWEYGNISANFGNTVYEWTNMPNQINECYESVATLLFHCGVSVEMHYGPTGSGAWPNPNAYSDYFGYSTDADYVVEEDYSATAWKNLIKDELDNIRPMVYVGYGDEAGHAWNCDGYQGDDHFHMNWGWGGMYDGYYYLDDLAAGGGFNYDNGAVIEIYPDSDYPEYCTGTKSIEGYEGTFNDGSGNQNYNNNIDCRFLVKPPCGNTVKLTFDMFDVENNDAVIIYDGETTSDEVLFTFYGYDDPLGEEIISSSNKLLVQFVTDGSGTAKGWAASYDSEYCNGNKVITESSGTLTDGSGPCDYLGNKICTWDMPAGEDECIVFEFTEFDLSYFKHYVRISEGNDEVVKYTNENPPSGTVIANGPDVNVRFSTALTDGTAGGGWSFDYYTTTIGINESTENSLLNMNVYPNPVNNNTVISYYLQEPSDVAITITDILGNKIGSVTSNCNRGNNKILLNEITGDLSSGIYLINLEMEENTATGKIICL